MVLTAQDKKWAAENDARTLAEADAIRKDTKRKNAAVKQAKRMAKEDMARAKSMQKVARKK